MSILRYANLVWNQQALDTSGNVLKENKVVISSLGEVEHAANDFAEFMKAPGVNQTKTVQQELRSIQSLIESLMLDMKNSRSADEVQRMGNLLNQAVELSKYLQRFPTASKPPHLKIVAQSKEAVLAHIEQSAQARSGRPGAYALFEDDNGNYFVAVLAGFVFAPATGTLTAEQLTGVQLLNASFVNGLVMDIKTST